MIGIDTKVLAEFVQNPRLQTAQPSPQANRSSAALGLGLPSLEPLSLFLKDALNLSIHVYLVSHPVPEYDPVRGRVSRESESSRVESRSLAG